MRGLDPRIHPLREKFLRRWMDCRVKPGDDSGVAICSTCAPSERNQQVYKMTAGAISLFPDCYLQWLAQLQRVGAAEAYLSPHISPTMCHHPS
jgi:hypothetical protein